jgi:hypothetical protein
MQINRRLLYAGVFLVAIGAVLVAADLGGVDTPTLGNLLRLWPLALVAVGAGLVLRRTRVSLSSGLLAAAVPGLVLGGALAAAPRWVGDCGARGDSASVTTKQGTFDGPATVSVTSGCGSTVITAAPGNGWQFQSGNSEGRAASLRSSARSLSIDAGANERWPFFNAVRDTWDLTLPTTDIDELSLAINGGHSEVSLPGARISTLALTANASQLVVDASGASVTTLSGAVRVGLLSIHLPSAGFVTGSVRIGAGEVQLCSPPGTGLHVAFTGPAREVTVEGRHQSGSEWTSLDYASAPSRADLRVSVEFGAVKINPVGGCK